MNEDIPGGIGIAGNQVVGPGGKHDEVAIGADRRTVAIRVRLITGGVDADPVGHSSLAVMNEGVAEPVGIVRNQVACIRYERDEAAISADRGDVAGVVTWVADGVDTDSCRDPGLAVMNEDILGAVGVAGNQVVGIGVE